MARLYMLLVTGTPAESGLSRLEVLSPHVFALTSAFTHGVWLLYELDACSRLHIEPIVYRMYVLILR